MAKIEFTGRTHVVPGRAFHRPGVYEVSDELAKKLTSDEPKVFKAVENKQEETDQKPEKPVSKMNKDELVAYAGEIGVEVNDEMTNDELKEAIKAHQEGGA